jgi:hypothetical protein
MSRHIKVLFVFFISCTSGIAIAQTPPPTESKTKITPDWNYNKDRIVLQFGYNGWFNHINGLKTDWSSRDFSVYFNYDIQLGKSNFSFAPGIGISTGNAFVNDSLGLDSTGVSYFANVHNPAAIKKSKITTSYAEVPLELRWRSTPDHHNNSWKVAVGLKIGLLIKSQTKTKLTESGNMRSYKRTNLENFANYRYGPTIRFGYGWFNIFAFYSLTTLFDQNKGPEITPFIIGISINGL